jgi:glutamine amidotransferase
MLEIMNCPEITIIDYGIGNILSVKRGFESFGAKVTLTSDHQNILAAKRVVLPGVGAFANSMKALKNLGLVEVICEVAQNNIPIMGICLGMQLLFEESYEFGITKGLGLLPGSVIPIPSKTLLGLTLKTPHIGWRKISQTNQTNQTNWHEKLLQDSSNSDFFYFVHSFMGVPRNDSHRIANCFYGDYKIAAIVGRDKIIGCQFHPEKSGNAGLKILRQFCAN